MKDIIRNNYALVAKKPNLKISLFDWAYGEDRPFYWRHLLVALGFAVLVGLTFPFVWGLPYSNFLPGAGGLAGPVLLLLLCLFWGAAFLLVNKILIVRYFWQYSIFDGINDNRKSIKYTLDVIKQANNWMVLYDYGENQDGNIYSDADVQEALLAKLSDSNRDFKLSMIFKNNKQEVNKLPLVQTIKQWQKNNKPLAKQVEIICGKDRADKKYLPYNQECDDFPDHYKINDAGYAYLTTHAETVSRRKFTYYKPVLGWYSERVSDCLDFHNSAAG